ncbi:MAG TPA: tetratricopeptide repeat protein [Burkholderiales bacterium]
MARGLLRNGQPKLACELLELTYGRASNKTDVLLMQATCSRELERYEDSIAYYQRLIELEPKAVRPRAELGALYLRLGRAAEARAQFAVASQLQQEAESAELLGRLVQELAPIGQPAALAQSGTAGRSKCLVAWCMTPTSMADHRPTPSRR